MIEIPISPQSSPTVSSVCAFLSCATHPPIAQKMHFPQFAPNFGKFLSQIINAPHLHQTSYDRFSFTSHMYSSTSLYQISLLIPNMFINPRYVQQSQIIIMVLLFSLTFLLDDTKSQLNIYSQMCLPMPYMHLI